MQILGQTLFWTFLQGYFWLRLSFKLGFPGGTSGKESTCQCRRCKRLRFNPWVLEMATHSSILAWKIPWTEQSGGLQSMGSQKVRHDWAHTHLSWLVLSKAPSLPSIMWVSLIQSVEGLNRTKDWLPLGKKKFANRQPLNLNPEYRAWVLPYVSSLSAFRIKILKKISSSPGLQPTLKILDLPASISWAKSWTSLFLPFSFFLDIYTHTHTHTHTYTHTLYWFCFSGEPWQIHHLNIKHKIWKNHNFESILYQYL